MKILITGGKSNIGRKVAEDLSKRGHIIYIGVKTEKEKLVLEEELLKNKIIMFVEVINLLDEKTFDIIDKLDLDAIILHASSCEGGSIIELSKERVINNIDVNVIGNFLLIQKYLRYCYENKKKGKIFITSSIAAFLPLPYLYSYTSTKLSLYHLAKTLRLELLYQKINVRVSLILPGAYYTGFNDLMIENKEKDNYILAKKAHKMTLIQKIYFSLIEKINYNDLTNEIIKQTEKNKPKFIISKPFSQKIFTKLYLIISTIIEC